MRNCLILAMVTAGPAFGQDAGFKSEVAAVRIVRQTYGKSFQGLSPFNAQKGTAIAIIIQTPKGGVIAISQEKSKLTTFTDDKGTKLLGKGYNQGIGGFPKASEDRKAAMVEINGANLPAPGAKAIRAKGTISISLATKKNTLKSKPITLKPGEKVNIGEFKFVLKKVGKSKFGNNPLEIELEAKQDLGEIAEIRFEDAKGKAIKSRSAGSGRMGFGNVIQETRGFAFEKKIENCVIVIDRWADKKDVDVPFDVRIGIGG